MEKVEQWIAANPGTRDVGPKPRTPTEMDQRPGGFALDPTKLARHIVGRATNIREGRINSHVRTNRRGNPNIQRKTYHVPSLGRRITLIVSAKDIKTIDRDGIDAVVARLRARGVKL